MKLDIENIMTLRTAMESLSHGIDPTSNIEFPNDTILNSNVLKLYFSEAAELFALLEANIDKVGHLKLGNAVSRKIPFHLETNEIENIRLIDEPITISRFVFLINETCHHQDMKKLKATQITAWLVAHGYLEEIEGNNGNICKSSTEQGRKIGITSFKKVNSRGDEYVTNTYDRGAQEFILTTVLPQIAPVLLLDI